MNLLATINSEIAKSVDLSGEALLSTVVYALLGMALLVVFMTLANRLFRLNLRDELVKDNNVGLGVAVAGVAIAIAIVIAATIR